MDYTIILGYAILLVIQFLAIQALFISMLSGYLTKLSRNLFFSALSASVSVWIILCIIWFKIFDYAMPFLAFLLSVLFQAVHLKREKYSLSELSKTLIIAEIWGIIITAIFVFIFLKFNWY